MLVELAVRDLGIIDRSSLVLGPGMTALTGETGAGKTMIVQAIHLLTGGRADATMVRVGAEEAVVEGRFVTPDGEEIVLRRVVPANGRSRAYVDGHMATAAHLSDEGARLVDLHGQHQHQSLLSTRVQRQALDGHAGIDLTALRAARDEVAALRRQLDELGGDARARAHEIDLLRYQAGEIDAASVAGPDELFALEELEDTLADATAHIAEGLGALASLTDDGGVVDQLGAGRCPSRWPTRQRICVPRSRPSRTTRIG
jgi:DNA repair protein RecN (Recombination protein N)